MELDGIDAACIALRNERDRAQTRYGYAQEAVYGFLSLLREFPDAKERALAIVDKYEANLRNA